MRWMGVVALTLSFVGVLFLAFAFKDVPISEITKGTYIAFGGVEAMITVKRPVCFYSGWVWLGLGLLLGLLKEIHNACAKSN